MNIRSSKDHQFIRDYWIVTKISTSPHLIQSFLILLQILL